MCVCVCVCVCGDAKYNQEKEGFLNVIQESGTSTQREGTLSWAHSRSREKPIQNGVKCPESVGTGDSVSYEAQGQRNGGNLKIDNARRENKGTSKHQEKLKLCQNLCANTEY